MSKADIYPEVIHIQIQEWKSFFQNKEGYTAGIGCGGEISGGVYVILALQAAYNMELNFQTEKKIVRKGFTLIELLVVVLIMGILASVAMPQYYKSVEKSRISEVIEFTRAYISAQNRQWMKTGTYATGPRDLDIGYPNNEPQPTFFDITNYGTYIKFKRKTSVPIFGQYRIEMNFTKDNNKSPYKLDVAYCMSDKNMLELRKFR